MILVKVNSEEPLNGSCGEMVSSTTIRYIVIGSKAIHSIVISARSVFKINATVIHSDMIYNQNMKLEKHCTLS